MISTLFGSTPYCCRITLSRLTLACVRPTTPILRPESCAILVIFGPAFLPLALTAAGERANDCKDAGERNQRRLAHRRVRRRRGWRPDKVNSPGHRSGKQAFEAQFHLAGSVRAIL